MQLASLLRGLGWADEPAVATVLEREWEASQAARPDGPLGFLQPDTVAAACRILSLPASAGSAVGRTAAQVASDVHLQDLLWHFHYCVCQSPTYPWWGPIANWPGPDLLTTAAGVDGHTLLLLVVLSGLPGMVKLYADRGIADDILRDSLHQLRSEVERLHDTEGIWGLAEPGRVQWHRFALRGENIRLGRLTFQFGLFRFTVKVYRHRRSGTVVALSEDGVAYLPNGQADGPGRLGAATPWPASLELTTDGPRGHPIHPCGYARRDLIHLPAADWELVLARDDPALYLHIPGGEPLDHEDCGRSIGQAVEFFPRHFPDRPFVCFCCESWVLNARLQTLLPDSTNMVRFQREFYLLPYQTFDTQLSHVILGGSSFAAPLRAEPNALQRALLDEQAAGRPDETWAGACFLLPEDLAWGQQVYLKQPLPWDDNGAA